MTSALFLCAAHSLFGVASATSSGVRLKNSLIVPIYSIQLCNKNRQNGPMPTNSFFNLNPEPEKPPLVKRPQSTSHMCLRLHPRCQFTYSSKALGNCNTSSHACLSVKIHLVEPVTTIVYSAIHMRSLPPNRVLFRPPQLLLLQLEFTYHCPSRHIYHSLRLGQSPPRPQLDVAGV